MPHNHHPSNTPATATIRRIAGKEVTLFFASPIAYLFLATFAAVTLFIFFWGESFFARNIADVRPLFEWMPVLLIFLASTLTMRLWSEERRTGTLEHVLTQPVPLWHFVVGKFAGCLVLLIVALIMTLPLPMTVAIIGDLDWGPVWAGYLATLLLGATYLSIGLFVSARSDNQIVSLISAVALCGVFYLIGSPTVTAFFGNATGEWLRLLGTGSRFEAITRGVIDLRDLYYYLSLIAVFLSLNTFALERERWATSNNNRPRHRHWRAVTALLIINVLGANFWLGHIDVLRVDATEGNQYSISNATYSYLNRLQEPLLLRGYFSRKTHPMLAPLVPQLKDLLREYEVAGDGQVRVEIVDPITNPELEKQANQKYGIKPMPFQVANRYQASIVSSYFNVLVKYGDEYEVLGFRDLIDVKATTRADVAVRLRNPEYDLTRAIKNVLRAYQTEGNLFNTVEGKLTFNAYISGDKALPKALAEFRNTVATVLNEYQQKSGGQLEVNFINPEADGGKVAQRIAKEYGFQPMTTSLFSDESFYFYLTLAQGDKIVRIPLADMTETRFRQNLEAGIKRFASGFTKTVALVTPEAASPYGRGRRGGPRFNQLKAFLRASFNVQDEDLSDGRVSGEADILLLASPKGLGEKAVFAVDQFLMKGGTVVAATSPFSASLSRRGFNMQKHDSGLEDWLAHHGLTMGDSLVLDTQSAVFPMPITRNLGGFRIREIRMLDYPYFIDIRGEGLNQDNMITGNLRQVTMAWASPIEVDKDKESGREITPLLHSSPQSWLSTSLDIMPNIKNGSMTTFTPEGETKPRLLGVISTGRFESYFAGQESPLLEAAEEEETSDEETKPEDSEETEPLVVSSVIERSPESARLILFSSNEFLRDRVISLVSAGNRRKTLNSLQLVANTLSWALEDRTLLSIRSGGYFNRTLPPMERGTQLFWEYLNYGLAALALALIALAQRQRKKARERAYLQQLGGA